jgi:hypothetical protein
MSAPPRGDPGCHATRNGATPDHDRIRSFDEVALLVGSRSAALDAATSDQVKQLIALVVEDVTTKDRKIDEVRLRPGARPFFRAGGASVWCPRAASGTQQRRADDLGWYAMAV